MGFRSGLKRIPVLLHCDSLGASLQDGFPLGGMMTVPLQASYLYLIPSGRQEAFLLIPSHRSLGLHSD